MTNVKVARKNQIPNLISNSLLRMLSFDIDLIREF
jgi:hypothetical protein